MCGIIVVCMVGMFCEFWEAWLTWNSDAQIPFMSNTSKNNMQLRLIAMSWIFNESIDTSTFSYPAISDDPTFFYQQMSVPVNLLVKVKSKDQSIHLLILWMKKS